MLKSAPAAKAQMPLRARSTRHIPLVVFWQIIIVIALALAALQQPWSWVLAGVALLVGLNILWTGWKLLAESSRGLLDEALPEEDRRRIATIMERSVGEEVEFHAVRTRVSGARSFLEFHMLVPGKWSVQYGHDLMEDLVDELVAEFPGLQVIGHLEPIEDPRSYADIELDAERTPRST